MGQMQLTEMRDALRWALDNKQNLTAAQLNRWLNWTYFHVSMPTVHKHRGLQYQSANAIALVTNQVTYDIHALASPNILWGVHSVVYIDGTNSADYSLRRKRLRQTDIRFLDESVLGQGEPTEYAMYGGGTNGGQTLYVNHRPGTTQAGKIVLVRGWRAPTRLTADADMTVLFESWDELIVLGATWRGWRELNRPERAEPARVAFAAMVTEIASAERIDAEDWGTRMEIDLSPYQRGADGWS